MKTAVTNKEYQEKKLLLRISGGDERAFAQLFHAWQGRMFQYIRTIVKSPQVAEEIVLDVMTKLWLGREMLPRVENLNAFLFRIAYRRSVDFLRTVARSPKLTELLSDEMEYASTVSADSTVIQKEYELKLSEAITLLSPQRRKVYEMSRKGSLSHEEIAARLNLSKYTVNNHVSDAVRFIRHYLVKHLDIEVIILYFFLLP
ncbi:RNA polymerase sigma-70 factor (ECF subfamily) [Anseongella ginsenosidimutans]|uniref:RNA polymerase sigma-70 factor (ECF subfamily) n=1 Tax=Anseongella ginsenosidimutans TaxID=496056 RepID=A0A4R3KPT4_9SPHI|nr:RNA polymerase sigma-70 factor [Anseongella ginsenosidimutans]QEC52365.1 RNA polymerase sigma-70 factor [Anseongella ginsenosidimutans]TCS85892.1 RNA polymerase sigma-70 factor (ECF subfamily) [Anseongella ginsenosidimutans]